MQQVFAENAKRMKDTASAAGGSRYLATRDAAAYLDVSESFLNKARHFGTGPRFTRAGRSVRYDVYDLDAWMAERRATSTADYGGEAA